MFWFRFTLSAFQLQLSPIRLAFLYYYSPNIRHSFAHLSSRLSHVWWGTECQMICPPNGYAVFITALINFHSFRLAGGRGGGLVRKWKWYGNGNGNKVKWNEMKTVMLMRLWLGDKPAERLRATNIICGNCDTAHWGPGNCTWLYVGLKLKAPALPVPIVIGY